MPLGRMVIQSNVIAVFMLQQRRRMPSVPTAVRHALTGGRTLEVLFDILMATCFPKRTTCPSWLGEWARCGLMAILLSPRLVTGLEAVQNYHGLG
jgi:hypothetical protein